MATMQALLFPVTRAGFFLAGEAASSSSASHPYRFSWRPLSSRHASSFPRLISQSPILFIAFHSLSSRSSLFSGKYGALRLRETKHSLTARASSSPISSHVTSSSDDAEKAKLAQVAKRLENTSRSFQRLGSFGFWGQLVCTVVAAVILSFSVVVTGKITSPATFYATATGIAAGFISVFWSFGYIRLSERLQRTAKEPSKAPPRADVVKSLKNGIILNLIGMGAAVLGMQATVGLLVAKALTSSAVPYYQGTSPGYSPVLALDVFLVQASANTILSHFLGLVSSLELLRSVTTTSPEMAPIPKMA